MSELHGAAQDLEALLLHRVHVTAGHMPARVDDQVEGALVARGVLRGLVEDEQFLADRVVEYLSAERHRSLLKGSARAGPHPSWCAPCSRPGGQPSSDAARLLACRVPRTCRSGSQGGAYEQGAGGRLLWRLTGRRRRR